MIVTLKDGKDKLIETFYDYIVWTDKTWSGIGDNKEHAQLGLISEIGELADCYKKIHYGKKLDKVNLKEEIGDICYYLARSIRNDHKYETFFKYIVLDSTTEILSNAATANNIDEFKEIAKDKFQNISMNLDKVDIFFIHVLLKETFMPPILFMGLQHLCLIEGISFIDAVESNIRKLETRYNKGKFDINDATNRNLNAERESLK